MFSSSAIILRLLILVDLLVSAAVAQPALEWRSSVVFKNPGQGLTVTKWSDPSVVAGAGFNVMTVANGRPPHCAITWDDFDPDIFPIGSDGRVWVEALAQTIDKEIASIHERGLKAMYWFDMFVLPTTLVSKYGDSIKNSQGQWAFESESMQNITLYLLDAVFRRFPTLDGLLIRTGEIYTQDVPYHSGASPITQGYLSHIKLLEILRKVVLEKYDKLIFYRTWSFDGLVSDPKYYLNVTNAVSLHPKLFFVIKHTQYDFWRTTKFNPTIDIGRHPYLVEVQCQREYEGKGSHPNYVMNGVIEGFEENAADPSPKSLSDLSGSSLFKGIVAWPRGGGWLGPYPADEFWIDMNVKNLVSWALKPHSREEEIFNEYSAGLQSILIRPDRLRSFTGVLRKIALLSARGVLLGHYSLAHPLNRLLWTRDWYIGGGDSELNSDFKAIIGDGLIDDVLAEKAEASQIWAQISNITTSDLIPQLALNETFLSDFLHLSSQYGRWLYTAIEQSWIVSLYGMAGQASGSYNLSAIAAGISGYDKAWDNYRNLRDQNSTGALSSFYTPWGWGSTTGPSTTTGAYHSVGMWRYLVEA